MSNDGSNELRGNAESQQTSLVWLAALAVATVVAIVVVEKNSGVDSYRVIQVLNESQPRLLEPKGLTEDRAGHLIGAAMGGGQRQFGALFDLSPISRQDWQMRVLPNEDPDARPNAIPDIIGDSPFWLKTMPTGDIYGVTNGGGLNGGGTLFRMRADDHGWGKPTPVYQFPQRDIRHELSGLVAGKTGCFYGTIGGAGERKGFVFQLCPSGDGWVRTTLHDFQGGNDGAYPIGDLVLDDSGALYGVTSSGGIDDVGTIYRLTPVQHGWNEEILLTFLRNTNGSGSAAGILPLAGLTLASDGTFYGTADGGDGAGIVFSLSRPGYGHGWTEHVLYKFKFDNTPKGDNNDGNAPNGRLVIGKSGELYGTTKFGGIKPGYKGWGTVFKLEPTITGWSETVIHRFSAHADGCTPSGALIRSRSDKLYGTIEGCAMSGIIYPGTVFEISPGWSL